MFSNKFLHVWLLVVLALCIGLACLTSLTIGIRLGAGYPVPVIDVLLLTFDVVGVLTTLYVLSKSRQNLLTAA